MKRLRCHVESKELDSYLVFMTIRTLWALIQAFSQEVDGTAVSPVLALSPIANKLGVGWGLATQLHSPNASQVPQSPPLADLSKHS